MANGQTQGRPATWDDLIRFEAEAAKIPPDLALSVARAESNLDPGARSPKGAQGLFQLMPATAAGLGVDPNDPVQNIKGGIRYLKQQLDAQGGDVSKALAAYNWGPGNLAKGGGYPPETQAYIAKVLSQLSPGAPGSSVQTAQSSSTETIAAKPAPRPPPATAEQFTRPLSPSERLAGGLAAVGPKAVKAGIGLGTSFLEGIDPRTPTGREGLGALAGEVGMLAATRGFSAVPGIAARVTRILAPIVGAGVGGAAAQTAEQAVGGAPPDPRAISGAGERQALYSIGGQVLAWPFRAVGQRLMAGRVAKGAEKALTQGTLNRVSKQIDRAFQAAELQPPIGPTAAGRAVNAVRTGPAQRALDAAGLAVEAAAAAGPPVNWQPVRAALTQMGKGIQPQAQTPLIGAGSRELMSPELLAQLRASAHPLPGLLGTLQQLPDEISFADAHRYKRLLDDAINWESPAKRQIQGITKGARQAVRSVMAGFVPYDEATATYQAISPLYRRGIVPKLMKVAVESPEAVTTLIRPQEPVKVQMLRKLLLEQAESGGGGAAGRQAWDAVRSAWTHEHVFKGGIKGLQARIGKVERFPEFVDAFYGDAAGTSVWKRAKAVDAAYRLALDQEAALGRKLALSSLGGEETAATLAVDALTAAHLPVGYWKFKALLRVLRGPKSSDLLQWAAYSGEHTERLVRALTGGEPGVAAAQVLRGFGAAIGEDLEPKDTPLGPPPALAPPTP